MQPELVLSLFPGADLLGLAFEEVWPELCIVRGPDVQYGSMHDIKRFHAPAGVFDGVIGGPPCQMEGSWANLNRARGLELKPSQIPEFERVVAEAQPRWFLMENVSQAPIADVSGYAISAVLLNNRWFGEPQNRLRRFSFGIRGVERAVDLRRFMDWAVFESSEYAPTVMAVGPSYSRIDNAGKKRSSRYGATQQTVAEALRLQGLPPDFLDHSPMTVEGKQKLIGNGVPLPVGRAIATAIRRALDALAVAA